MMFVEKGEEEREREREREGKKEKISLLLFCCIPQDTLGALALGTEAPTDELMQIRPYGRR